MDPVLQDLGTLGLLTSLQTDPGDRERAGDSKTWTVQST